MKCLIIWSLLLFTAGLEHDSSSNTAITVLEDPLLLAHRRALHNKMCSGSQWHKVYQNLQKQQSMHRNKLEGMNNATTSSNQLGHHNKRRLIFTADGSGTNDMVAGMMTAFYAALLTNRSFQLTSHNNAVGFQAAFDRSMIDWTVSEAEQEDMLKAIQNHQNDSEYVAYTYHNGPSYEEYIDLLIPQMQSSTETIIYMSNRGYVYNLFTRSHYKDELFDRFKIEPSFCIYCAFHFIFRPKHEILQLAKPFTSQLSSKETLKIGIQIRTGDNTFWGKVWRQPELLVVNLTTRVYYQNFFECAEYIESIYNADGQKEVKWYLMSDSLSLRQDVVKTYGSKVVTNINDSAIHVGIADADERKRGLKLVMSEVLTLSLCDFFVLSYDSGIGRLGAWLSENRDGKNVYVNYRTDKLEKKSCTPPSADAGLANSGAGI